MIVAGFCLNTPNKINKRAGVIVYTVHNNELYFLLGIDRRTREFTDFGGGCKQSETLLESAWREFGEESCDIFKNFLTPRDLQCSVAVTNPARDTAIFFVYVPDKWLFHAETKFNCTTTTNLSCEVQNCEATRQNASVYFENHEATRRNASAYLGSRVSTPRNASAYLENINVKWVKDSDFYTIAFNKKSQCMWGRVQKFLMNNVNYTELKLCLIIKLLCGIA